MAEPVSLERMKAWRALQWAVALVMNRFRDDLGSQGLSLEEFDVLIHLSEAPDGIMPLSELAGSMVLGGSLTRSGLTRLLDRMESSGLVVRELNPFDRRRFDVRQTHKGRRVIGTVWPDHERGIREYFSDPLDDRDIETLGVVLRKIIDTNEPA